MRRESTKEKQLFSSSLKISSLNIFIFCRTQGCYSNIVLFGWGKSNYAHPNLNANNRMANYSFMPFALIGIGDWLTFLAENILKQDKVNYAVSEREDRATDLTMLKRMTGCNGMYLCATGLRLGCNR